MSQPIDYRPLDLPQISQMMFYPQRVWTPTPTGASDHLAPVGEGVAISARFYPRDRGSPSILFFHGNGEVACDYDDIAPLYAQAGTNLFVADYRGYGRSGGVPFFSAMVSDAQAIFQYFRDYLLSQGYGGPLFVKGRSLGCLSAVEVAAHYQEHLGGLITESGSAALGRMARRWSLLEESPAVQEMLRLHQEKLHSITLPLLVIHGERDELVPLDSARELYDAVGSQEKHMEIIPQGGHNDLLWVGQEEYFEAVRRFIARTH